MRLVLLALALSLSACSADSEPGTETLASVGIVDFGKPDGDDFVFGLVRIDQRFRLDPDSVPDFDGLIAALQSSGDTGRSIRVIFGADSGRFDRGDTLPSFRVHRIEFDGATFDVWRGPRKRVENAPAAEAALARGVAYYTRGSPDLAVPFLDSALAGNLRPELRTLALKTRGNALFDSVAIAREAQEDADDRQLLRALGDFRQWSALEPENPEAQLSVGISMRRLGAYEEALQIFNDLLTTWPDQRLRIVTRIGATYRILGEYTQALATLDEFAAGQDPPYGMMFSYHRGWILNLMGRHEEAVRELSEGLKTQPDYGSAFQQRSCAYAQLGRLREALQDHRRASELDSVFFADSPMNPAIEHDRAWARSVDAALESAISSGSNAPNSAPCVGYWSYGETRRERSRLLPAHGAAWGPAGSAI